MGEADLLLGLGDDDLGDLDCDVSDGVLDGLGSGFGFLGAVGGWDGGGGGVFGVEFLDFLLGFGDVLVGLVFDSSWRCT